VSAMALLTFVLVLLGFLLLVVASLGITNSRVQLLPLALALVVLAHLLRLWPP